MASPRSRPFPGFTLVELLVTIVILAVLSGIAVPKYVDCTAKARESTLRRTLGAVRSAIANAYADSAGSGAPAYPTLAQLQTVGAIVQDPIPANPFNNDATVAAAIWSATAPVSGFNGWNYDPVLGRFWANSIDVGENAW